MRENASNVAHGIFVLDLFRVRIYMRRENKRLICMPVTASYV
jgi:hypothetical protein